MRIAIASGKGGTGKTTIATNLAAHICRTGSPVTLLDCDVEEPNAHLFLKPYWESVTPAGAPVPGIRTQACRGESCRICVDLCRFKALIWMGEVMTFPELCHGCGLCMEACPEEAIVEESRHIGDIRSGYATLPGLDALRLHSGCMRVGEAMAPPLIRCLLEKETAEEHDRIIVRDCPPGTSCPVITSLEWADYTVLVSEPTPFGMHDLQLAVDTLRQLNQPFGAVINRYGFGDDRLEAWLEAEHIPVLARLPHNLEAAAACAEGTLLIDALPSMRDAFSSLWTRLCSITGRHTESAAQEAFHA